MTNRNYEPITIKGARLFKTNFSGKEIPPYNPAGRRNFCVFIDDLRVAEAMEQDGWNIRWLDPREEGDERKAFLSVEVSFRNRPPKIVICTRNGQTQLREEDVNMLDWAEKTNVDLAINPRYWEDGKKTRIKAFLRTMKVDIYEDEIEAELEDRYTNAPVGAVEQMVEEEEQVPFD